MSDEAALLSAIVADPDEDTPRLVYADWLDEHATTAPDRARAEFIRVQVELARLPDWGDDAEEDRRAELSEREKRLLGAYRNAWLQLPDPAAKPFRPPTVRFRRGFPEEGGFRANGLAQFAAEIHAHSLLRRLEVSGLDAFTLDYLLDFPWLDEVRGLELVINRDTLFDLPDLGRLADCRRLGGLRALTTGYAVPLTRDVAQRFAANPALAGVRGLSFWTRPGADSVGATLGGAAFESLRVLEVYNLASGTARRPAPPVGGNPRCAGLERLRLNGFHVAALDLVRLVGDCWPRLRELRLGGGSATPEALHTLGRTAGGRLETLSLRQNGLSTLRGLGGPGLETLRSLDLSGNRGLPPSALAELAGRAPGLRHLDLSDCPLVDDTTAELLAGSAAFADLHQIELINCAVGPAGAVALAESPHLSDRLTLYLHDCPLGGAGKAALRARFGDRAHW